MERLCFSIFLALILFPRSVFPQTIATDKSPCAVTSASGVGLPTCYADMSMILSNPSSYCDHRVVVVGYLDAENSLIYSNSELADRKFSVLAARINDESASLPLKKERGKKSKPVYVILVGIFQCAADIDGWVGLGPGEFIDIEQISLFEGENRDVLIFDSTKK